MRPYRQRWQYGQYRHDVTPAVRRMGCAFAALIAFAAFSASMIVSLFALPPHRGMALGISLLVSVIVAAGFAVAIRRAAKVFGEQIRLRRQLMTDVAHELRTPLAILQGRIEGLLDGVYPRDDEHVAQLLAETQHLSRLVEDVRMLANAEAGVLELRKERVDLAELVRDAASAIGKPVSVKAPDELLLDLDPVRIREVLLNLLSNAVQHTDGAVEVTLEARPREAVILVRDHGRGIPADELPRLFERFHKGRESHGSGLGLAITRKLVLAHGGQIHVESREGEGTTFVVSLPR